METYGIRLDEAMGGALPVELVAVLAEQLPQSCRWRVSYDRDAWWNGDRVLQAALVNSLNLLIWGMADKAKRGPAPRRVGPSWMAGDSSRTLPAVAMGRDELLAELSKPRRRER